ncbi:MAG: sterol desaturase family protein [Candidatus Methylomirabilis sp.]|nr:sterol desaturase family protein [Deltaproteobacteria bacterium]
MTEILAFPLTMAAALWAVHGLLRAGVHEGVAVFGVLVASIGAIAALERLAPYRAGWNRSDGDVGTDFAHMLVAQSLIPRLLGPLWPALAASMTAALAAAFGARLWPHDWPILAQLFLVLVIAEFGRYWFHRAAHEIPLLWRLHAVHHSPGRLYWLNAGRFHPLEKVIFLIPEALPFAVLGAGPEVMAMYFVFNGVHGLFQHSNIRVRLGPLNYLFSMTELHRWHHSKIIAESNTNYGNNLILWDLVFGTFFLPKDREVGTIGLLNPAYPKGYLAQLAAPFARGRLDKPEDFDARRAYYEDALRAEADAARAAFAGERAC